MRAFSAPFERHVRLRHLLQGARRGLLVGGDVGGLDIEQVLLARPVAPLVAGIAAERPHHDGGQQAGELGQLDRRLGDLRRMAGDRPRQMAERDVPAGLLAFVRPQDDVDRHALRQVERDRLVGSPMPPAICGGISMPIASARRRVVTSTGASWASPCRRCRARGPQDSAAITSPPWPSSPRSTTMPPRRNSAMARSTAAWAAAVRDGAGAVMVPYISLAQRQAIRLKVNRFCRAGVPDRLHPWMHQAAACPATIAARRSCWSTTTRPCARCWPSSSISMTDSPPSRSARPPRGWRRPSWRTTTPCCSISACPTWTAASSAS